MRSGLIHPFLLAGLTLALPVAAAAAAGQALAKPAEQADTGRPTVQIRLAPLDDLIRSLRYVVKKIGREEEGKQLEELLRSRTGPKGLEGVDTKKPIGFSVTIHKQLDRSEMLFLLPIADEKVFLQFLDNVGWKAKRDKDGSYTALAVNVPFPILFRFAHGYLYGTLKFTPTGTIRPAERLPKPETAFGDGTGLLSLAVHLGALPPAVRKAAVPAAALYLGNYKDREMPPASTAKQKALRDGLIDEATRVLKRLIDDGASLHLRFDLDRKSDSLSLAAQVEGPKSSTLAKEIAALGSRPSLGPALMVADTALGAYVNLPIPAEVRKVLRPVVEEYLASGTEGMEAKSREQLKPLLDALLPTFLADSLTGAADFRGPTKGNRYTLTLYARAVKGKEVEKASRTLLSMVPAEDRSQIETDVARVNGVAIHQLKVKGESLRGQARRHFGDGPVYLALRDDAFLMGGGPDALGAIKSAAAATDRPGKLLHAQFAFRRLGAFTPEKDPRALIEGAFADQVGDRAILDLGGGDRLSFRLRVDLAVLKFGYLLSQAEKKKD